jgi:hypothetical protein
MLHISLSLHKNALFAAFSQLNSPFTRLQGEVIANLLLGEFAESGRGALARLGDLLLRSGDSDDTNLDGLGGHLALKALLEGQERSVDRVLEGEVVVVPVVVCVSGKASLVGMEWTTGLERAHQSCR